MLKIERWSRSRTFIEIQFLFSFFPNLIKSHRFTSFLFLHITHIIHNLSHWIDLIKRPRSNYSPVRNYIAYSTVDSNCRRIVSDRIMLFVSVSGPIWFGRKRRSKPRGRRCRPSTDTDWRALYAVNTITLNVGRSVTPGLIRKTKGRRRASISLR